jgi:hypothetical protein
MAAQRRLLDRWQHAAVQAPLQAPNTAPGPARAAAPSTDASALPGRDAELAALQRAPHPAVVVLGEPGAGKSTLLAAAFPGSPVLRGLRGLDRLPYRPVLDALRQHTAQLERALADPFSRLPQKYLHRDDRPQMLRLMWKQAALRYQILESQWYHPLFFLPMRVRNRPKALWVKERTVRLPRNIVS